METNEKNVLTKINDIEKLPMVFASHTALKCGISFYLRMEPTSMGLRIGYIAKPSDTYLISVYVNDKADENTSNRVIKINETEFNQYEITTGTLESAVNILYGMVANEVK